MTIVARSGRWHIIPCIIRVSGSLTLWVSTPRHALILALRRPLIRRLLGALVHRASDWLHLLAHRIHGDPDWRARNG